MGNVILKNVAALRALTNTTSFSRVDVALLLRELKTLWELCRDVALVEELVASGASEAQRVTQRYQAFSEQVAAHGLVGVWDLKPLLNVSISFAGTSSVGLVSAECEPCYVCIL